MTIKDITLSEFTEYELRIHNFKYIEKSFWGLYKRHKTATLILSYPTVEEITTINDEYITGKRGYNELVEYVYKYIKKDNKNAFLRRYMIEEQSMDTLVCILMFIGSEMFDKKYEGDDIKKKPRIPLYQKWLEHLRYQ